MSCRMEGCNGRNKEEGKEIAVQEFELPREIPRCFSGNARLLHARLLFGVSEIGEIK